MSGRRIGHFAVRLFPDPGHGLGCDVLGDDASEVGQSSLHTCHLIFHRSVTGLDLSKKCSYDDNQYCCYCFKATRSHVLGYLPYLN